MPKGGRPLQVPVAKWLHGGQSHPIMLASPHGMDILGYVLHDLGVARTHLAKHGCAWLLSERDKAKFCHIPESVLEMLVESNDEDGISLKKRQKAIAGLLKSVGYKVEWI